MYLCKDLFYNWPYCFIVNNKRTEYAQTIEMLFNASAKKSLYPRPIFTVVNNAVYADTRVCGDTKVLLELPDAMTYAEFAKTYPEYII